MATAANEGIALTLTHSEAVTLVTLFQFIGGHPDTTRRGDCDAIRHALQGAGVYPLSGPAEALFTATPDGGPTGYTPGLYWQDTLNTL